MNIEYSLLLLLLIPVYMIWRYLVALKRRGKVADRLDKYLGTDAPERLKVLLLCLFDDAMKPTIILQIFFKALTTKRQKGDNSNVHPITQTIKMLDKNGQDEFYSQLLIVIGINVRLAPLTYFTIGLLTLMFITFEIIMNISTKGIKTLLNSKVEKAESAYLERV